MQDVPTSHVLDRHDVTQDLKSKEESSSEASSASTPPTGVARKVAVKQAVQPVLQNPGYGSSGGVQVTNSALHLSAF